MKLLRLFLPLIVIPSAIAIAIAVAVLTFFPQKQLREWAAGSIGKKIHRQLVIGPVHLRWNGIEFDSLKVSEEPSFKAGTLFEADGVRLGWHLSSLWSGLDLRNRQLRASTGSFFVKSFRNPFYTASDFSLKWSLENIDSTGAKLDGWAKLDQGPGALKNVETLLKRSASSRAALAPLLALVNLERSGVVKLGLPDLKQLPIESIQGNYTFDKGLMTLKTFSIQSPVLRLGTTGTVKLSSGELNLHAEVHTPATAKNGALDAQMNITGTTSKPTVDLSSFKKQLFKATVKDLLNDPAKAKDNLNNAVKNLFH